MNTCSNCKFWRHIRDENWVNEDGEVFPGPHGECNRFMDFAPKDNESGWIWVSPYLQQDIAFITKSDFYCKDFHERV